jgi:Rha family phage regulatory protein
MNLLTEVKIEKNPNYGLVVSSRVIANELGKRHADVLESLDKILENGDFRSLCIPSTYKVDGQHREYKEYLLTKDGFTLYMFNIQGYNDFKMAYINKFNEMEKALLKPALPQTYKEALLELVAKIEENEKLQIENKELKPKGDFYDAVAGSDSLIDMNQVAKTLNVKGLGRNKLFEFLRNQKILMSNNQPYQQYVDRGFFKLIEVRWTNPKTGDTNITMKTMVFQTGLDYIRKEVVKHYKP